MTSPHQLLDALGTSSARSEGPSFSIRADVGCAYVARNHRGRACLLIAVQTTNSPFPVGRVTGALSLTFAADVEFDLQGRFWTSPCAIIECLEEDFLGVFCALAMDLASTFENVPPRADVVGRWLAEWERLFRCRRKLSEKEEMGLWSELTLIKGMPNLDSAVRSWRGPYGELTDFLAAGVGVECKASRVRLQHHISAAQAHRPRGTNLVYLVSMWLAVDDTRGQTLPSLIGELDDQTSETIALEKGLLAAGYSRSDAALYTSRFVVLEEPLWFGEADLPRVRAVDPGVLELRYVIQLDDARALTGEAVGEIVAVFNS
ncbi:MAG: PD-(D/E)XK motif protein [Myxococcales bacterium]